MIKLIFLFWVSVLSAELKKRDNIKSCHPSKCKSKNTGKKFLLQMTSLGRKMDEVHPLLTSTSETHYIGSWASSPFLGWTKSLFYLFRSQRSYMRLIYIKIKQLSQFLVWSANICQKKWIDEKLEWQCCVCKLMKPWIFVNFIWNPLVQVRCKNEALWGSF